MKVFKLIVNQTSGFRLGMLIAILLYAQLAFAQQANTTDKYDLKFRTLRDNNSPWFIRVERCTINPDNKQLYGKKAATLVSSVGESLFGQKIFGYFFSLHQYFPLHVSARKVSVSLVSKHPEGQVFRMFVVCMNAQEKIVSYDTVRIKPGINWTESSVSINTDSAKLLFVRIEGGKNFKGQKNNDDERIWLGELKVKVDGNDIYEVEKKSPVSAGDMCDIVPNPIPISVDDSNSLASVKGFSNHRIISLGESVHGCETINRSVFKSIQYLIEKENCKLVLLECPHNLAMMWNYYIQNKTEMNLDTLISYLPILYSPGELKNLLKWLRSYNELNDRKVKLVGMDLNPALIAVSSALYFEYLKFSVKDSSYLRELKDSIYLNSGNRLYSYFSKNDRLKLTIGEEAYNDLLYSVNLDIKIRNLKTGFRAARDLGMAETAKNSIEKFLQSNEKAVIYSHIEHANKLNLYLSIPFDRSMGSYMKQYYGDDYFVAGIFVGEGSVVTLANDKFVEDKLLSPPVGSLEYCCGHKGDYFYSDLQNKPAITKFRMLFNGYGNNQFFDMSLANRIDGIFFIKSGFGFKPFVLPDGIIRDQGYYYKLNLNFCIEKLRGPVKIAPKSSGTRPGTKSEKQNFNIKP